MTTITVELDEATFIKMRGWGMSPATIITEEIAWIQRAMDWEHERALAIAAFVNELQKKTGKEWFSLNDLNAAGPGTDLRIYDDRYYDELEDGDLHSAMDLLLVERRGDGKFAFEYRACWAR